MQGWGGKSYFWCLALGLWDWVGVGVTYWAGHTERGRRLGQQGGEFGFTRTCEGSMRHVKDQHFLASSPFFTFLISMHACL